MIRRRRFISLVLLLSLIAQIVGQAVAGASVHNQSNAYNNVVSPSAQYNTDQVGPYNAFFANKKEAIHPGNGNLMVSQT
ncbi:MAG: hypothetical protein Q8S19_08820, partial [Bacillota bacterium]|nr:hypothetical protein [Bacillota bacterium]